jgi:hypothetical protein
MKEKEKVHCGDCKFAESFSDPNQIGVRALYCHFNPPMPVMIVGKHGQMGVNGVWAPTTLDQWCGKGEKEVKIQ